MIATEKLKFHKYQGTGNDFIMIDNRNLLFTKENRQMIASMCDRRFGIGADGLILLENDDLSDFRMVYFNADGNESSMCGNGGRCIVAFAQELGIIEGHATFNAIDGRHEALISRGTVSLKMIDVIDVKKTEHYTFLDTGSPHHVQWVENLKDFDVVTQGKKIRYGLYGENGSNINFVANSEDGVFEVRTYERGVENETLSCGTGVTAVAIAINHDNPQPADSVKILTKGGHLEVSFKKKEKSFVDIWLKGPATKVFEGQWQV